MGEAVEKGCGHLGVAEDGGPFAEAQVGGDDDAGALVEFAQQMEEQRTARGTERQVAQFVQDHEIEARQAFGDLAGLALGLFLFQCGYGEAKVGQRVAQNVGTLGLA